MITPNKVTEAGFELSNFKQVYHLLGLIDGHGTTYTRGPMRIVCIMGGWEWCLGNIPLDRAASSNSQLPACSAGNTPNA